MSEVETQDLTYNITGQSLVFVARSRPASITSVDVFKWDAGDDATAETATTGSASIDSVNTTFDAASGASQQNPLLLSLASTASIVQGRHYLATTAAGLKEWVEARAITSGASITSRVPLLNDYASSDTFESTRVTISVLTAWIQDENNFSNAHDPNPGYRVKWVWVDADGATQTDYTFIKIVRMAGRHSVTPPDMVDVFGAWMDMLPHAHRQDQGAKLIDQGYRKLEMDFHSLNVPDDQVRNDAVINWLTRKAAVERLMYSRYIAGGSLDHWQAAKGEYEAEFNKLFKVNTRVPIGTDSSGAGASVDAGGVWSR